MRRLTAVALVGAALLPGAATAADGRATVALFGDSPYGPAQLVEFPKLIQSINADRSVRVAVHVGDIKSGSTRCDDAYFATVRQNFDAIDRALVYTPGDNEWTDCHRANNGGYLPTERLAALRSVFYPRAGRSLGQRPLRVLTPAEPNRLRDELADEGVRADTTTHTMFVEHQLWRRAGVVFSTPHIVGSNNNLAPWFGAALVGPQQRAEYDARLAATLEWIDTTFDIADADDAAGVVLAHQANMWDGGNLAGFNAIVAKIAERSAAFERPVLVVEGDTHAFVADKPLTAGSPRHGVTTAAPNVTRLVVQGSADFPLEWLRLSIDSDDPQVFSWQRVLV